MTRTYYTLIICEDGRWSPQFGDYDKATVVGERRDSFADIRKRNWRIITTTDDQQQIDAAIQQINLLARLSNG